MHYGIGYLSELVDLYNFRRDDLFSKNVRYFLKSKKNTEKGPSAEIRATLKQISVDGAKALEPELFAFYHNGVTMFARAVEITPDGLQLRDPFVLNGCQTIKTAFNFLHAARLQSKIDIERWNRIAVPVRVITTRDEGLINTITINNNRQNAISYAALRANDPVQIRLEERFRAAKVFYQRQEGAHANLEDSNPEIFEDDYANSLGQYVEIVELARSIAAVAGEIEMAKSPSHIFESEAAYQRCFSNKRLSSIVFLTFLQNLHDLIFVVLKKDLNLKPTDYGPKPSRLGYYVMCLLVRYLAKYKYHNDVVEFGQVLWGRSSQFRIWVTKILDNYHSGIKRVIDEKFLSLPDSRTESLNESFRRAEASLYLKETIDVFEIFKDLDDRVERED